MPTYVFSLTVDAAVPRVWGVLTDVERWPEITASMTSVRGLDGPDLAVGRRFSVRQPRLREAVWTVTTVAEGSAFSWTSRGPGVATRGDHLLEPDGAGTRLTLTIEQNGVLAWPVGLLAGGLIRRYLGLEAQGIKARSESPSAV